MLFGVHGKSIADTGCDLSGKCWPLLVNVAAPPEAESSRFYQPMLFYAEAATLSVLPVSAWSIRLPMAIVALLNIVLMFRVGRELGLGVHSSAVGALILASAPQHVFFSRQAVDYLLPVPFVLIWMIATLKLLRCPSPVWAGVSGAVLLVGMFSYVAAWVVMPSLMLVSVGAIATSSRSRVRMAIMLVAAATAGAVIVLMWQKGDVSAVSAVFDHYAGGDGVSVYSQVRDRVRYYRLVDHVGYLWQALSPVPLFFIANNDLLLGTRFGGMLLVGVAPLLVIGVANAAASARSRVVLVIGAFIGLLPAVLYPPASAQRELSFLPFATALAVLGWDQIGRLPWGRAARVACIILGVAQLGVFLQDYFGEYAERSAVRADPYNVRSLGPELRRADADRRAPAIIMTMMEEMGVGTSLRSYWNFYSLHPENRDIAARVRFIEAARLERQPVAPDSLIVATTRVGADALARLGISAVPAGAVSHPGGDPLIVVWRVVH